VRLTAAWAQTTMFRRNVVMELPIAESVRFIADQVRR